MIDSNGISSAPAADVSRSRPRTSGSSRIRPFLRPPSTSVAERCYISDDMKERRHVRQNVGSAGSAERIAQAPVATTTLGVSRSDALDIVDCTGKNNSNNDIPSPSMEAPRPPTYRSAAASAAQSPSQFHRQPYTSSYSHGKVQPSQQQQHRGTKASGIVKPSAERKTFGQVDLSLIPLHAQHIFLRGALQESMQTYFRESKDFKSLSLAVEMTYREATKSAESATNPNPLKTTISCYLLDQMIDAIEPPGSGGALRDIGEDVFCAVFKNYVMQKKETLMNMEENERSARFTNGVPFFQLYQMKTEEVEELVSLSKGQISSSRKQAASLQAIITRWQLMLVDRMFTAWRNIVRISGKRLRLVSRYATRMWKLFRLRASFHEWRAKTLAERVRVLQSTIHSIQEDRRIEAQRFSEEYQDVLQELNSHKMEKERLVAALKQTREEAHLNKLEAEKIQLRREEDQMVTARWRQLFLTAVHELRPRIMQYPSAVLFSNVSANLVSDRLRSWDPSAVREVPAERLILYWLHSILTAAGLAQAQQQQQQLSHSSGKPPHRSTGPNSSNTPQTTNTHVTSSGIPQLKLDGDGEMDLPVLSSLPLDASELSETPFGGSHSTQQQRQQQQQGSPSTSLAINNFDEDFRDGLNFLRILEATKIVRREEVAPYYNKNPITRIEFGLNAVEKFTGFRFPVTPMELFNGSPAAVYSLLITIMETLYFPLRGSSTTSSAALEGSISLTAAGSPKKKKAGSDQDGKESDAGSVGSPIKKKTHENPVEDFIDPVLSEEEMLENLCIVDVESKEQQQRKNSLVEKWSGLGTKSVTSHDENVISSNSNSGTFSSIDVSEPVSRRTLKNTIDGAQICEDIRHIKNEWMRLFGYTKEHTLQLLNSKATVLDNNSIESAGHRETIELTVQRLESQTYLMRHPWDVGPSAISELLDLISLRAEDLKDIFQCYAPVSSGSEMTHNRFGKFLSDTKMYNKSFPKKLGASLFDFLISLPSSVKEEGRGNASQLAPPVSQDTLNMSTEQAAAAAVGGATPQEAELKSMVGGAGIGASSGPSRNYLTLPKFVAAFVYIAAVRQAPPTPNASLATVLGPLIESAKKVSKPSGIDEFRESVYKQPIQDIFSAHNSVLLRIFNQAAGADDDPEMSQTEFLQVLRDSKMLDTSFNVEQAKKLFDFLTGGQPESSMVYRDFLEALVAVCMYKVPVSWVPLPDRLRTFLKHQFLPNFVKSKKR